MCRFFVYWGQKPKKLQSWITSKKNCLLDQSINDITERPNPDGWGFAYRNGKKIEIIKNTLPAFDDNHFSEIAENIYTDLLFAHVRRRSQGSICLDNTHPFKHKHWIFMHNGNIPNINFYKTKMKKKLPLNSKIRTRGTTDSEFLFKYFLYWYQKLDSCDLYCILNLIYSIMNEVIELTEEEKPELLALNFVLTNGKFVLGFRRNRSLFYRVREGELMVASEKIDSDMEWNEIPENHFFIASEPGKVKLAAFDIQLENQFSHLV